MIKTKKRNANFRGSGFFKDGTPTDSFSHGEIFGSPEAAATAIAAVVKFIKEISGRPDATPGQGGAFGFVIETLQVSFQTNVKRMRIHTNFASDTATILVPVDGTESEAQLRQIETQVLRDFLATIPEAQMRSALQFYRTLDAHGRDQLKSRFGGDVEAVLSRLTPNSDRVDEE